jgi:hypothetical protein
MHIMKTANLFLAAGVFLLSACHKTETEPIPTFSGITERDVFGSPMTNTPDPDDWNYNDHWTNRERALFGSSNSSLCADTLASATCLAFPNPCGNILSMYVYGNNPAQTIALRIVNQKYEVLVSKDNIPTSGGIGGVFDLDVSSIPKHQIVRVYYKISGNGCAYHGHGDVQMN